MSDSFGTPGSSAAAGVVQRQSLLPHELPRSCLFAISLVECETRALGLLVVLKMFSLPKPLPTSCFCRGSSLRPFVAPIANPNRVHGTNLVGFVSGRFNLARGSFPAGGFDLRSLGREID